jgi:hypothetical protein
LSDLDKFKSQMMTRDGKNLKGESENRSSNANTASNILNSDGTFDLAAIRAAIQRSAAGGLSSGGLNLNRSGNQTDKKSGNDNYGTDTPSSHNPFEDAANSKHGINTDEIPTSTTPEEAEDVNRNLQFPAPQTQQYPPAQMVQNMAGAQYPGQGSQFPPAQAFAQGQNQSHNMNAQNQNLNHIPSFGSTSFPMNNANQATLTQHYPYPSTIAPTTQHLSSAAQAYANAAGGGLPSRNLAVPKIPSATNYPRSPYRQPVVVSVSPEKKKRKVSPKKSPKKETTGPQYGATLGPRTSSSPPKSSVGNTNSKTKSSPGKKKTSPSKKKGSVSPKKRSSVKGGSNANTVPMATATVSNMRLQP